MEQKLIPMGQPFYNDDYLSTTIIITIEKLSMFKDITRLSVWGYSTIQKGYHLKVPIHIHTCIVGVSKSFVITSDP